jgi:hypothetical protein
MRVAWVMLIAGSGCGFVAHPIQDDGPNEDGSAAFDYASCPATYHADLPGPSRYRFIPAGQPAWVQIDACAADMPGATHLVVLESQPEIASVAALVAAPPMPITGNAVWIGGVQQRNATVPAGGWLRFDGEALTLGWSSGEPNDRGMTEDRQEQFVKLENHRTYLVDAQGSDNYSALCECDGKPTAQAASDAIQDNRPTR